MARFEAGFVCDRFGKFGAVQVASVEHNAGQIGSHEIDGDQAAIGKDRSFDFERVEFGKIEPAIVERYVKNEFVAHRKVDVVHLAAVERGRPQRDIIDLGAVEYTIVENAVDESHGEKCAAAEIASVERAAFEFLEIHIVLLVNEVTVGLLEEVFAFSHRFDHKETK